MEAIHAEFPRRGRAWPTVQRLQREPHFGEPLTQRTERIVCAMGSLGYGAEAGFVQPAVDDLTVAVANQLQSALLIHEPDLRARGCADPHREHHDPFFG